MVSKKGFTLIELLITIGIIGILSVVVMTTLRPQDFLKQSRDAKRLAAMAGLGRAVDLAQVEWRNRDVFGEEDIIYTSLIDLTASTTDGTDCAGIGMPLAPVGYEWHCSHPGVVDETDGTGWVPINFAGLSSNPFSPLDLLPTDPQNVSSTGFFYTYTYGNGSWKFTVSLESSKYSSRSSQDNGNDPLRYEVGEVSLKP